ncbi:MAG TPA: class I SAM-dependent methyltransferase [Rudaea sp.]|jgi:2-polyprenyl-3-methyl-5-hydroxy-6-metoxy-1,4-benzoquinol methylase
MPLLDTLFGRFRRPCRLCGKRGTSRIGPVAATHHGKFHTDAFSLRHCPHCGVVYLDPLPTAGDLKVLYEESEQFSGAHYTDAVQVARILDYYSTALRNLQLLPNGGGRVLEVGAGLAWVSRACKAANPTVETVAQDVSNECVQNCPWVDRYFIGPVEALQDAGRFDLISLTHVIEHLADPAAMLRRLSTLLVPNGKLFITAPFRPSKWKASDGIAAWNKYSYLHVPAHITYFSRRWFEQQKALNGLTVVAWDDSHEDGQAFELVLGKVF